MSSTKQVTASTLVSSGYKSPVGRLTLVASAQGLRAILWPNDDPRRVPAVADAKKGSNSVIESTTQQLDEYFAGTRHEFDVPLEQATVLGDPNKARAVGTANGRNPISIVVPCHRVIGANGSLTGFAGGMKAKKFLLDLEKKNAPARLPIRKANEDPRLAEMFSKGLTGPNGEALNIFGVLGNHPDMLKRWLVFATHVLSKNTLTARDRELLILRTGWNCRSRYEWGQHVEIALRCDISAAEIKAVKKGASASTWSPIDKLLLTAADELHNEYAVSDATWRNLGNHYSNEQILDLIATVGNYHLVAMFLNSTKVPIDAGIPDDPDFL